ncbi:MAG: hypothetical protein UEP57_12005 [Oscillospiraceae bacterium]|nr:hypothetical protein [Oscillospiraceae bacterium]
MKKNVMKLFSLVLVLAMVFTLVGCSAGDKDKLVGTWKCELELADQVNEEMALDADMAEYLNFSSFKVVVWMEFTKDGTYSMYADREALQASLDEAVDGFADGMAKYLEDMILEQTGLEMSAEEILAASGITMDEMLAEAFPDDMADEIADSMEQEGKFEAKDGKLFTSAGLEYNVDPKIYETYELTDSKLTITGYVGDEADMYNVYPMVFEKVS